MSLHYPLTLHQLTDHLTLLLTFLSVFSNDCTVLGENLTDSLQSGSRDLFAFVIALGFMFYISVPVTFVALAVIPSTTYLRSVRPAGRGERNRD